MFLTFAGDNYYPIGGWDDYRGTSSTIEEAREKGTGRDWYQIVELGRGIVEYG